MDPEMKSNSEKISQDNHSNPGKNSDKTKKEEL